MAREVPFFGEFYRRTTGPLLSSEVTRAEARFIAEVLELRPGARVLDLGCGEGRHLARLAGAGARLVGLDRDLGSLASARRHAAAVSSDLRALPFRPGSFDAIYCWYSTLFIFEEAENRRALAEASRALAPGGAFLFQSVNPERLGEQPAARFEERLPDGSVLRERARYDAARGRDEGERSLELPGGDLLCARYAVRYYSLQELAGLFRNVNLRIVRAFGGAGAGAFARESLDLIVLAIKEG
jgi:SAM-dependent methyltransferase